MQTILQFLMQNNAIFIVILLIIFSTMQCNVLSFSIDDCLLIFKKEGHEGVDFSFRESSANQISEFLQCNDNRQNVNVRESHTECEDEIRLLFERPTVPPSALVTRDETLIQLPIQQKKAEILDMINCNRVVVISSETGSGKTTQVPQFILDQCVERNEKCRIICTQPRRLATVSVARRVSSERGYSRPIGWIYDEDR